MSRIEQQFRHRGGKRTALIPFLNVGDPTQDISRAAFEAVIAAGADIVELGVPYSDPLADGPVIQASAIRSLEAGFSFPKAFDLAADLRRKSEVALILFSYVNPLIQYGVNRFFADAAAAGVDGVIVPDLPTEESDEFRTAADAHGLDLVPLLAPTSGSDRIARICKEARGFVYCVSSLGVTGERARMSDRLRGMVQEARENTNLPIAVGFGVSGPEQAATLAEFADGVIVGSSYVRRIGSAIDSAGSVGASERPIVDAVSTFTHELCDAVR
jgi:tryptophan synthase alpha chain